MVQLKTQVVGPLLAVFALAAADRLRPALSLSDGAADF